MQPSPTAVEAFRAGRAALQQGQPQVALEQLKQAVELSPETPQFRNALAAALQANGRLPEAIAELRATIQLQPGYAEGHNNLASALAEAGQLDEAEAAYRRAISLKPEYTLAQGNLGMLLKNLGRPEQATPYLRNAAQAHPQNLPLRRTLFICLRDLGLYTEAEQELSSVLQQQPSDSESLVLMAGLQTRLQRQESGIATFRAALKSAPDSAYVQKHVGVCWLHLGWVAEAVDCFRRAYALAPQDAAIASGLLFALSHDPRCSVAEVFAEHQAFEARHAPPHVHSPRHRNSADPERRLRIGYVSADFKQHAVSRFLEPVLQHHDPSQVEVFCYSEVRVPDAATRRFERLAQHWRSLCGLNDTTVAEQIRADQIDILIDVSGHTTGNRLPVFALRPAPVQVTYLGYPWTTGLTTIDYRLSDAVLDPPGQDTYSTEKILRLSRGATCLAPIDGAPDVNPLPALTTGQITFGSLHRLSKINPAVLDLWAAVLREIPASRLLILRDALQGSVREQLEQELARRGVPPDRLDLRSQFGHRGHLATFNEIDISLDTFPYAGGTISCEALWMGVPVLTLRGSHHAARAGASLATQVGVPGWIAESPEQYVRLAADWAARLPELAELRSSLRDRVRQTLCDAASYAREMELAYRTAWRGWCQTQS